ncbi:MAG: DUF1573 domain-containing protein [Bacteroidota bacterium]|nr:DUF1573 domain-containing protein [Bacteroidota bacterium]MDP4204554.1 DUF1573 domain-containing protein [Bacteroidota bacterium]
MKMLSRSIFIVIMFVAVSLSAQDRGKVVFNTPKHDFGTVREEGGVVSCNFHFKNAGKIPLVINNVIASCGCTTPEWSKAPIPPGGKGFIRVSYNPLNRPGNFNKEVRVLSNAENSVVVLTINGNVLERSRGISEIYPRQMGPVRMKSNYVSFTNILDHQVKSEVVEFFNDSNHPVTIAVKNSPAYITAKMKSGVVKPQSKGYMVVTFDAKKCNMYGFITDRVYLTMNGQGTYDYSLGVSANIMEDFSKMSDKDISKAPSVALDTDAYNFGEIKEGQNAEHTFHVYNRGKSDLIIRRIRTSCGCTAAKPTLNIIPKGRATEIRVVFDSKDKRGRQSKSIEVITNDPKRPVIQLSVTGNVLAND